MNKEKQKKLLFKIEDTTYLQGDKTILFYKKDNDDVIHAKVFNRSPENSYADISMFIKNFKNENIIVLGICLYAREIQYKLTQELLEMLFKYQIEKFV